MATKQLRIPGPTPLPPEVRKAAGGQMINHRGKAFKELYFRLEKKLQKIFQTKNDVFFLTASGTGGMEAAIVNLFSPGDHVIVASIGYFGDRFAAIAKDFGLNVASVRKEDGKAFAPEEIAEALRKNKEAKAVLITHNETSTGTTNDLAKIAPVVKKAGKLLVVDAISSLVAIPLPVDRLGIDVCIAGSQKALMAPPGIAIVSVSKDAWDAHRTAKLPRNYFDFSKYKKFAEKGVTPETPAVGTLLALDASTNLILKKGLQKESARHKKMAADFRKDLKKAGFVLLAEDKVASYAVTATMLPENLIEKTPEFITLMREKYGIEIAPGQGALQGKIFRVGHMGFVTDREVGEVIRVLAAAKRELEKKM